MYKTQVQFGGGAISPQLIQHLKRAKESRKPATTVFGGGAISPQLLAHLKRARTQFGGGVIHPKVAAQTTR